MKTIKLKEPTEFNGKKKSKGDILTVSNNIAHGLIERGVAKLYTPENKMMTAEEKTGIKSWNELRKEASEKGLYEKGMTKEDVIEALDEEKSYKTK